MSGPEVDTAAIRRACGAHDPSLSANARGMILWLADALDAARAELALFGENPRVVVRRYVMHYKRAEKAEAERDEARRSCDGAWARAEQAEAEVARLTDTGWEAIKAWEAAAVEWRGHAEKAEAQVAEWKNAHARALRDREACEAEMDRRLDAARAEIARLTAENESWDRCAKTWKPGNRALVARAEAAEAQITALTEFLESEEQPYPSRVLPLGCVSIRVVRRVLRDAAPDVGSNE